MIRYLHRAIAVSLLTIVVCFCSCKKHYESTPASAPKCYEKFLGNYHVTDLQTGDEFDLSIEKINNNGQSTFDSLIIRNFANRFDVRFRFFCGIPDNYLNWAANFGINDYQGHSWALYNNAGSLSADTITNVIINSDTIYFDFKLTNIAFYLDEGVPYYACESCIQMAVRQEQ